MIIIEFMSTLLINYYVEQGKQFHILKKWNEQIFEHKETC